MGVEPVPAPRYVLDDLGGAIRVEIPLQGRETAIVYVVFAILMIVGCGAIGVEIVWGIVSLRTVPEAIIVLSLVGIVVLGSLLLGAWSLVVALTGKEVLDVNGTAVCVRRIFNVAGAQFTVPRPRVYSAEHVRELRLASGALGGLAFDYGASTVRFARGVDEAEAKQILRTILARFPGLGAGEAER